MIQKTNLRKYYFLALIFLITPFLRAQEGVPVYLDYLTDNYYLVYPSMAGIGYTGKARATARQQWFDQDEAPNLQTINAHVRLGERSGVGAIVFNDQNGYHSQTGLQLTYAHHINLWPADLNQLSFGMSVGVIQSSLDETDFDPRDFDPIIAGIKQSTTYLNVDVGMSYSLINFYAHVAIKNLLFRNRNINSEFESSNQRKYLFSAGYLLNQYSEWSYEPSLLFQWTEFTDEKSIDANIKVYKEMDFGKIWGGISYRNSFDGAQFLDGTQVSDQKLQWISPLLGVNYNRFMFAYTYTYQIGDIKFDSGGFHQITIGYDFLKGREPYPCKCPWVE